MKADGIAYDITGDGPWLMMINGIGAPRGSWSLQVEELATHFRCLTFDNPGIGESDNLDQEMTTAAIAATAARLLDIVGARKAHVMGVSMGGAITQELLLNHRNRIDKAVVVCSWSACDRYLARCFQIMRDMAAGNGRPGWSVEVQRFLSLIGFARTGFADGYDRIEAIENAVEAAFEQGLEETASTFVDQANACLAHDTTERLELVGTPTLVMAGDQDAFTPLHLSSALSESIPEAELQIMEGCGHVMFYERPSEFNRRVIDFLARPA